MPYLMVDDHLPILVTRRVGVADARSVETMLAWVGQHLRAARGQLGFVYDAGETPGGIPDAAARRAGGEWLRANGSLLRDKCVGLDFALPSPVSRGALTAVFWIARPSVPYTLHGNLHAAIAAATVRLGEPSDLTPERIVADLARRPSL